MKKIILSMCLILLSASADAYSVAEKDWGIALGFRIARIPYPASEKQVADVIPLLFYDGDTFFIRGLSGGIKLYNNDAWQFSLLGRYRYFDIPADFQNLVRGSGLDVGGELKYRIDTNLESNLALMSDDSGRLYSDLDIRYHADYGSLELFPYAIFRIKSAGFNDHYYGLDGFSDPLDPGRTFSNPIGSGFDLTIGSELRYHVISNFYLIGRAQITSLDRKTRQSTSIDKGTFGEVYLGIAFFNDKARAKSNALDAKPYIRVAHGWATPSDLNSVIKFNYDSDIQDNQLTSFFYGHPVSDTLFGIDAFDIYITTGFVYHHRADPYTQVLGPGEGINTAELSKVSGNPCDGTNPCSITYNLQPTTEYDLAIKAYYNLYWPFHWRFGAAEGLSYVSTVTNIEQREMDKKGYRSSNLVNFIDITLDLSLGDAFGAKSAQNLYLGIGVHHRSSIFETSSAFGRIKGGSNYVSTYLQYHF